MSHRLLPDAPAPHTRRDFLKRSCGVAAAVALASCGVSLAGCDFQPAGGSIGDDGISLDGNLLTLDLTRVTALQRVGGSLWLQDTAVIVVHAPDEDFRAFSSVCAHEGNPVRNFEATDTGYQLRCSSHGWTYDLTGRPTGFAERSIPQFPLTREGDLLRVTLA